MSPTADRTTGCLFCGNSEGRFESEEHVIPMALGNNAKKGLVDEEIVLPPGEVCDPCNSKRLTAQDNALTSWSPISAMRSLSLVANRRGKLVNAVRTTQWQVALNPANPREARIRMDADTGAGSGRDAVARALCKIALECRWMQDQADARSARWDPIAHAAIGGPLPTSLAMGLTLPESIDAIDIRPDCDVLVADRTGPLALGSVLDVVGLRLLLLVGVPVPPPDPLTSWWTVDPQDGALRGPNRMWLDGMVRADHAQRLPSTSTAVPKERSIRLPSADPRKQIWISRSS